MGTRYVRYAVPSVLIFSVQADEESSDPEMEARARAALASTAHPSLGVNDYGIPVSLDGAYSAIVWLGDGQTHFDPDTVGLSVEDMGEGVE